MDTFRALLRSWRRAGRFPPIVSGDPPASEPALRLAYGAWESVLVRRGVSLWLGVRVLLVLGTRGEVTPTTPTFASSIGVIGVAALLAFADLRRRREEILLADLGVPAMRAVLWCILPALCLEALLLGLAR